MAMHSLVIVLLLLYSNASAGLITTCEGVTDTSLTGFSINVISLSNQDYRAYYMGGTGGIVSALSSDGIVWTQESGQRLQGATNPWVFRTSDNRFRMIYERQDSGGNRTLYSAISIDGLNFTQEKQIMAGTSVDINPQSNTTFLSVPTGLSLGDGSLRMYFVSDGTAIRSAVSEDEGLTWSRDEGTRITNGVDPAIITLADDSYLMFYTDWSSQYRIKRILYATSYDGLNFTTASSPFISEDDLTQSMMDPEVIPASNGRYRLYFSYGGATQRIYSCLLPQSFTTVSIPNVPSGPTSGSNGISYSYTTGGSTSSYGHTVEYQFDWKGDGTDLSPWDSATQSKIWTSAGTYNVRARARCATDTSVVSGWSSGLSVTIVGGGIATRDLPDCYISFPLTVTITVTPGGTASSYAVEDSPPNGWTVTNINESGLWDSVNKKVKWGPFFDYNARTLTYQATPPVVETETKMFSGSASFDGMGVVVGGDSAIGVCSFHPAETNYDYRIGMNEVTAYGSAWKTGQNWPTPPNPIPVE